MAKAKKSKTTFIQYITASYGNFGSRSQGDIIECDTKSAENLVEMGVAKVISKKDAVAALEEAQDSKRYGQIPRARLFAKGARPVMTLSAATQPVENEEPPAEEPPVVDPQIRSDNGEDTDPYGDQ